MSQRRRTGFRGPELRGTLGTLLRSTLEQAGVVRDAIERGAREGRSRLEEARAGRKRTELLADLGEAILDLIRGGEIDVAELPEIRGLVRDLDDLDADAEPAPARARSVATPPNRSRFDDRPRRAAADDDDGTVASAIGSGVRDTLRAAAARVWRPPAGPGSHVEPDPEPRAPRREPGVRPFGALDPARKGGISFDDDLADYMHPDDVPPRGNGGDGGDSGA